MTSLKCRIELSLVNLLGASWRRTLHPALNVAVLQGLSYSSTFDNFPHLSVCKFPLLLCDFA